MNRLYVAEKPSVARAIAQELGIVKRAAGYIEVKGGDTVSWCLGHLLELCKPDVYQGDEVPTGRTGHKIWRERDLPIIPDTWRYEVREGAKAQYQLLGKLLKKAKEVVNAGDPDREGQLLVDEVLREQGYQGPVLRYWASAADPKSVKQALGALQDNQAYQGMSKAALCRARADWLIGMNGTRAYTLKARREGLGALLSLGRVQTPTLALVNQRDEERRTFKAQRYFKIGLKLNKDEVSFKALRVAQSQGQSAAQQDGLSGEPNEAPGGDMTEGQALGSESASEQDNAATESKLTDANQAAVITAKLRALVAKGVQAEIIECTESEVSEAAPLGYDLAALQDHCDKLLGLTAAQTLEIAQALYEKYRLTSYPRTESRYLPQSQYEDSGEILEALQEAFKESSQALSSGISAAQAGFKSVRMPKIFNDEKVSAHHAIVPTSFTVSVPELSATERGVYLLIVGRYLEQFLPVKRKAKSTALLQLGEETFKASGEVLLDPGFSAVTQAVERELGKLGVLTKGKSQSSAKGSVRSSDKAALPKLIKGESVAVDAVECVSALTKPPAAYTEGSLILAMQNVYRSVSDEEYRKLLKDGEGIGTAATRANIIAELKRKGYMQAKKRELSVTELGQELLARVPEICRDPVLTAQLERQLNEVELGTRSAESFERDQERFVRELVALARAGSRVKAKTAAA